MVYMAKIAIYDATDQDKDFFSTNLAGHQLAFIEDELDEHNADASAEVVSVFVSSKVTSAVVDRLTSLKCLATRSTGYNHCDIDALKRRNAALLTVPTYGEHTVAEYTFGLLLSLSRKLPKAFSAARSGDGEHTALEGFDLAEKTLGIIGAGRIGQNVARIANGFSMNVIAYDPMPKEDVASQIGFSYVPLDKLLAEADIVTIHVPLTNDNSHLINNEKLQAMKQGCVLINTARGELVDTKALIESLTSGHLAGAALDVIEGEELIDSDEELALLRSNKLDPSALTHSLEINVLKTMPNVLITSHNAFNTKEAVGRINQTTANNITAFLAGNPVNEVK